ncbi:RNA polymerase sigma-70 factor [Macellibacteroides fermentans]|uniref:RNA polymerase sigma-70 factor n=1 Tax=Macellibacteroides fermentans TaxID=879969 RepID=UPI00406C71B2
MSDLKAFNQLFTDYHGRFIRFANSYVRDTVVSEDIVVEALMYYWENKNSLTPDSNVPAYILTIIKHKCLNYLHHINIKEGVEEKLLEHATWELSTRISSLEACDPSELFTVDAERIVNQTLSSLPERTRKIFILSRYENKSHKEIAEELNITTKGVEFHITKALSVLRVNLKDYMTVFFYLFYLS